MIGVQFSYGQREKNNIYLFDCTGSMKSNNLWDPAKNALNATIYTQTTIPGSQFCIVPFGDKPYGYIEFGSGKYQEHKTKIEDAFNEHVLVAKYTRISDVLKAGFKMIDPNKENKIYLLTDGIPNGGDSPQKVANVISEWCGNHRNCRLFYVALTNGVINSVIKKAIDDCPDAFIIQCEDKVIPQIADISSKIYTNLDEIGNSKEILFSLPGKYELRKTSNDSLFDVDVLNNVADGGRILISLRPKGGLNISQLHEKLQGGEHEFTIQLQCKDKRYFIANPYVTINVSDEVPSKLTLAQGVDELQAEGVKWYDAFLWSDAAKDEKVKWDLNPIFKNRLINSYLEVRFVVGEEQASDFQAWYNGKLINDGDVVKIEPDKPAMLEIQFNHDAQTGKRYFSLVPDSFAGLNIINEQPVKDYEGTSLRTEYNQVWNPLKTFMFWLALILLVALIIWFAILKRIFYPTIKMSKVVITGPESYYKPKNIKGFRKIILTSRRRSQNIFSRIFTGKIGFIKSDYFSQELSITPVGTKKKVKVSSLNKGNNIWDIFPITIFGQYEKGTIINRTTKEKTEIEFN